MAPKKGAVEEVNPEDLLPAGWRIGCEVYWNGSMCTVGEESQVELRPGQCGRLQAIGELAEDPPAIDMVEVAFEKTSSPVHVALSSLGLGKPPLEMLTELSTGLRLPLSGRDVERLWQVKDGDFDKQAELIMQLFDLKERYGTGRREIICDFHLFNLVHSKSLCLSPMQTAVFLAIMDQMLEMMKSSTQVPPDIRPEQMCTAASCFQEFQRLILAHAREEPPNRLGIFKDSEVRLLADFASTTIFKHYLLYQYCINFDREIETLRFNMTVSRPSAPPDLKGATKRERRQPDLTEKADQAPEEAPKQEETKEPTEEEKIAQMVEEKLREVHERLQAKLDEREDSFMQRLEEEKAAPKKKAK
mmetsp:Transcript_152324/g.277147  ORF Transcript_152324/g.277147 Transcript_152324/m.277147 type:complete len:360 (+) Transcript_152324:212-1291(+)